MSAASILKNVAASNRSAVIGIRFGLYPVAAALGISALAYVYARRHRDDRRFSFGTGKFGELAAFASAIVLAMVAVMVAYESILRLAQPVDMRGKK